jgi:hypothetical protein
MTQSRRYTDREIHSQKHIILAVFAYLTLTLAFVSLAVVVFWLFWPYKVIEYPKKPFAIVEASKTAPQGGVLSYEYDYTKFMDVSVAVDKQFVDGVIFQCDSETTRKPVGTGHVHAEIPIPETLPPGTYKLRIIARYQVNPLRVVTETNETATFTVTLAGHPDETADQTLKEK